MNCDGSGGPTVSNSSSTSRRYSIASFIHVCWSPSRPSSCERTSWLIATTSVTPVSTAAMRAWNAVWIDDSSTIASPNGAETDPRTANVANAATDRTPANDHRSASSRTQWKSGFSPVRPRRASPDERSSMLSVQSPDEKLLSLERHSTPIGIGGSRRSETGALLTARTAASARSRSPRSPRPAAPRRPRPPRGSRSDRPRRRSSGLPCCRR